VGGDQKAMQVQKHKAKAKTKKHKAGFLASAEGLSSKGCIFSKTCPHWMIQKPQEILGCLFSGKYSWRLRFPAVRKL